MIKDRGAKAKSKAKRLSTNFCHQIFVYEDNPITIANPDSCFCMRVRLARLVHDDELAMVPCLDINA